MKLQSSTKRKIGKGLRFNTYKTGQREGAVSVSLMRPSFVDYPHVYPLDSIYSEFSVAIYLLLCGMKYRTNRYERSEKNRHELSSDIQ